MPDRDCNKNYRNKINKKQQQKNKKANKQQKETSVAATIRQAENETRTKTTLIPVSRGAHTSDRKHDMNEKTTTWYWSIAMCMYMPGRTPNKYNKNSTKTVLHIKPNHKESVEGRPQLPRTRRSLGGMAQAGRTSNNWYWWIWSPFVSGAPESTRQLPGIDTYFPLRQSQGVLVRMWILHSNYGLWLGVLIDKLRHCSRKR